MRIILMRWRIHLKIWLFLYKFSALKNSMILFDLIYMIIYIYIFIYWKNVELKIWIRIYTNLEYGNLYKIFLFGK